MDFSTLLVGGALTGVVVGSWNKIKEWLTFLISMAFETVDINTPWVAQHALDYLLLHGKRSTLYRRTFSHLMAFHQQTGNAESIFTEVVGKSTMLFWLGWSPITIGKVSKPKTGKANEGGIATSNTATDGSEAVCQLRFIRGTINVVHLLAEAKKVTDQQDSVKYSRFFVKRCRGGVDGGSKTEAQQYAALDWTIQPYGVSTRGDWLKSPHLALCEHEQATYSSHQPAMRDNLKHLYYPKDVVDLIEEMRYWLKMREWHRIKRIPWRRGWLLYGKPGTGKTALARAFCQDVDLPLFVYDLASMSNTDFTSAWEAMKRDTPCVALFEDFDNVFHGRENVAAKANNPFSMMMGPRKPRRIIEGNAASTDAAAKEAKEEEDFFSSNRCLTFDTILNAIDGIERCDGIFLMITTNHLEKIDEALGKPAELAGVEATMSTRPGRIDRVIELKVMLPEHKKAMSSWILDEFPAVLANMHQWIDNNPEVPETPAQFQERCSRIALQEKFKLQEASNGETQQ